MLSARERSCTELNERERTDMNKVNETLTLQEAADLFGVSRSRIWRATNEGHLLAKKRRVKGRKVWTVLAVDLEQWAKTWLDSEERAAVNTSVNSSEQVAEQVERSRVTTNEDERTELNNAEQVGPPAGVYEMLVDRLMRAERKNVELEMTLRQHQLLLTENAESLVEDRAKIAEAEAKAEEHLSVLVAREARVRNLTAELEETKAELAEARTKKSWFSWLSFRRGGQREDKTA